MILKINFKTKKLASDRAGYIRDSAPSNIERILDRQWNSNNLIGTF